MEALKMLEDKVRAAGVQFDTLRSQNRALKTKVKKLESELAGRSDAGDWREDRDDIRKRVSKLANGLESLL